MFDVGYQMAGVMLVMVKRAYEACKSENMSCPWCSGRIAHDYEEHDDFCEFQKNRNLFVDEVKV